MITCEYKVSDDLTIRNLYLYTHWHTADGGQILVVTMYMTYASNQELGYNSIAGTRKNWKCFVIA